MRCFCEWMLGTVLLLVLSVGLAHAQDLGLYEGEVPVASQSEADRVAALPAALSQVLGKLGGSAASAASADASQLLQQYRYREEMVSADSGVQMRLSLIARFDQAAVQSLLGEGGAMVWSAQRPQPLLWLAIDDGSGARIVSQDAAAAVVPLTARAVQRGLRVRLPEYDAQDQGVVYARDLSGSETYAVDTATQRYGGPALIGWMRRGDDGWLVDWRLRDGQTEIGRWQSRDTQAAVVLASGADGAADLLSQRYSNQVLSGPAGRYRARVDGLSSAKDFAHVMGLLKRQPITREITIVAMTETGLDLEMELSSDMNGLAQLLRGSGLESVSIGDLSTPSVLLLGGR